MTLVRLGYVAMSVQLQNASPSQTMTYSEFKKIPDRKAAIRKLERIAASNLKNCLRLFKHNFAHDIRFFRLSSRLVPLATHEDLSGWRYERSLSAELDEPGAFIREHRMRIDFHPDHFTVLNSPDQEILKSSVKNLIYHRRLLKGLGLDTTHRCVIHTGGKYGNREEALEQFIENWGSVPRALQKMIMLENDDRSFDLQDVLYLCKKLDIPLVFDYHHHLAHHREKKWEAEWEKILKTWKSSPFPVKMHISSPKSDRQFRAHHEHIDPEMFLTFLNRIKGSVPQIDCMIEAKRKDEALFRLMKELKENGQIEVRDRASFFIRD